jgi:hypothetical protein
MGLRRGLSWWRGRSTKRVVLLLALASATVLLTRMPQDIAARAPHRVPIIVHRCTRLHSEPRLSVERPCARVASALGCRVALSCSRLSGSLRPITAAMPAQLQSQLPIRGPPRVREGRHVPAHTGRAVFLSV